MGTYALKRILQLIPILLAITFLSFAMMRLAGSDAVVQKMENTGVTLSQEAMDAARKELGLDQPFLTQYARWLGACSGGIWAKAICPVKRCFRSFSPNCPPPCFWPPVRFSSPSVFPFLLEYWEQ